jgi:hypothetical protein
LTYTVGLPRRQPRLRLDQPSALQGARPTRASRADVRRDPDRRPAALQPHHDADYPPAQAHIQLTPSLITAERDVTEPSTEELLRGFMAEVGGFVQRVYAISRGAPARSSLQAT